MTPSRDRVLSGMRPTGQLHLGNYLGALENWVKLQDQFDCFYFVANWHVLTTSPGDIQGVPGDTIEMGADWLGAGLDPERSTLFIQSLVPEHAELHLLFSMATPVTWLERVPTYKEMVEQLGIESPSYGLLGYPLLQAADILMYKAHWVPVGADQVPHIELTREVARRFNNIWKAVFPEPQAKLTEIPKVPGTDGRKMSKSYGNADICPVFDLHRIFTPAGPREECATGCRTAAIGCLDCKGVLLQHMLPPLAHIRERRQRYVEKPTEIVEILHEGTKRARRVAIDTMTEVREAIKLEA